MPLFDFECKKCGVVVEHFVHNIKNNTPRCCGEPMNRLFPISMKNKKAHCGQIFNVDGVTLENLPSGPQHFDSYKKLKDYAKKNDLDIQAIL